MERKFNFEVGEYYHIYNRGVDKRIIFNNRKDYQRFIKLLYYANDARSLDNLNIDFTRGLPYGNLEDERDVLADIGAYCLMPNHFHLLIKEKEEFGISRFIHKIATSYSMYFNKLNERSGRLFQGPYKAKHVDDDQYLKYLYAYIHLNPLKIIDPNWRDKKVLKSNLAKHFLENYK